MPVWAPPLAGSDRASLGLAAAAQAVESLPKGPGQDAGGMGLHPVEPARLGDHGIYRKGSRFPRGEPLESFGHKRGNGNHRRAALRLEFSLQIPTPV